MSPNGAAAAVPTQEYEEFVPSSKLVPEKDIDTLCVDLPGFKKEQMTVQLTRKVILKISGQRPVGKKKYQRFQMEFPVSENCDKRQISAKLENGILYVKQPKLISSAEKKDKESSAEDAPPPKKPASELQIQKKTEERATSENTTSRDELTKQDYPENKEPVKEEPNNTILKTSEQTEAKSLPKKSPTQISSTSTLEDGETTSSSNKPDESTKDKELQKDGGIKEAFQFWKEKTAGDTPPPKKLATEPQDQRRAEEQAMTEKTTLRDENTKQDNAENTPVKGQAKGESKANGPITSLPEKSPSQKYSTSTSEDGKTSSGNKSDESIDDATTGTASNLLAKLKTQSKVMKMTLVALLILGIGGYVINMMKSSKKAKK